jgi:DNA ligase-1
MRTVHSTPELQAEASRGNKKFWQGFVLFNEEDDGYYTQTAFWQETKDGLSQKQFSAPTKIEGKNIGRSNETSPAQQARMEMDSTEKKQRDKGYTEIGTEAQILVLPMLAHKWGDRKHSVGFPLYAQPKLDGLRFLMRDGIGWSRQGKLLIPEVYEHLRFETDGIIIDGELMLPRGDFSFQETMTAAKKFRPELSPRLEYHVYDMYDPANPDMTFEERHAKIYDVVLTERGVSFPDQVLPVETNEVDSDNDIMRNHARFLEQGYEGTIIRDPGGVYTPGHRSVSLLKHKDFLDEEFVIVDTMDGKGKFAGAIMFRCVTSDGKEFDCGLKGSIDRRKEMFANRETYHGKLLTVKFQEKTDDGIPRFPVGISVRDTDIQG